MINKFEMNEDEKAVMYIGADRVEKAMQIAASMNAENKTLLNEGDVIKQLIDNAYNSRGL